MTKRFLLKHAMALGAHSVLLFVLGCWGATCIAAPAHPSVILTFNYPQDAVGINVKVVEYFTKSVEQRTEGRITVNARPIPRTEITAEKTAKLLRARNAIIVAPTRLLAESAIPELKVLELPYLFPSRGVLYAALDGDPGRTLGAVTQEKGLVILGFLDGDFLIMVGPTPLTSPNSFKGLKFTAFGAPRSVTTFEALGATRVSLPGAEIITALDRGVIDAAEFPSVSAPNLHFRDKTITMSNHSYAGFAIVMEKESWTALGQSDQSLIRRVTRETELLQRKEVNRRIADSFGRVSPSGLSAMHFIVPAERTRLAAASVPAYSRIIDIAGRGTVESFSDFVSSLPQSDADTEIIRVWYATNRLPSTRQGGARAGYSSNRGTNVLYGNCFVAIPKAHRFPATKPAWKSWLPFLEDKVKIYSPIELSEVKFFSGISTDLARRDMNDQSVLLYIHGFKNSFEDAVSRAAQFSADLQFPGVVMTYSWPARSDLHAYTADEASIEASEEHLTNFLVRLSDQNPKGKIHVIVHSMGNRGYLRAVNSALFSAANKKGFRFGQVILAAPDVDVDVFRKLAIALPGMTDRATLYISQKDKAVAASHFLHGYPRAGYAPPITVIRGVDTIDVSNVNVDMLGHGYVAEAKDLIYDMITLLSLNGPSPERRRWLKVRHTSDNSRYWAF